VAGTTLRIVDEGGRELGDRELGEVVVAGDCLAAGYRGDPTGSLRFSGGSFRSGDLGYLDRGWLYVLGRLGDVVIVAGQNLYPQEIEGVVGRLPGVKAGRVVAFGVDDPSLGTQRLVVLAEVAEEAGASALLALRASISATLFELLGIGVPDVLLLAPGALRKSSSGKPSRALMRSLYEKKALEPVAGRADRH
jgi:acyl-CoA synthetase (AMP-forming)/AMP-acid ligase II